MPGLIRKFRTIRTSAIAERWSVSDETVRRVLKRHNARSVQPGGARNSPVCWNLDDVRKIENKLFGGLT